MKVILSRKGFDSANGGIVSPVFPNGKMLSFPIPSKDIEKDCIKYSDLCFDGIGLDELLRNLGYSFEKNSEYCHLDPDLDKSRRKSEIEGWKAAFGQINQAAGYLNNQEVEEGDLFLFFGNFRHIKMINGIYRYARKSIEATSDYYGKPFQAIWGYMQVERKIIEPNEIMEYRWHPHACTKRNDPNGGDKNNTLYIPRRTLSFRPDLPGYGLFDFDEKRVLTMKGKNKATWKYNAAYDVDTRKNCVKDGEGIYYSGIWQELVLENAESWAESLF